MTGDIWDIYTNYGKFVQKNLGLIFFQELSLSTLPNPDIMKSTDIAVIQVKRILISLKSL